MAAYASPTDLQQLVNADELLQMADDGAGGLDTAVLDEVLERSSREIDRYINKRYPVPAAVVTEDLKNYCTRIARYWLKAAIAPPDKDSPYLLDYNQVLGELQKIHDGRLDLTGLALKAAGLTDGMVLVDSPPRLFGRQRR